MTHQRTRRTTAAALTAALTLAAVMLTATPASAVTTTISPSSFASPVGSEGSGQTVANLAVKDQSGTQDTWSKYVELDTTSAGYDGYRDYTVPASITPSTVSAIAVTANYRGPATAQQTWTWSLWNWSTSTWSTLGTNAGASSWVWKQLTFAGPTSNWSQFISASKVVRVRVLTTTGVDNALLDYEAVTITSGAAGDTSAPSAPTGLTSPSKTATSVNLAWTASTDNVGVTGYDVYRGTTLVGTVAATSAPVTGLTPSTAYSFTVRARDAAGNVSAASAALSVTTSAAPADTTAPSTPTGLASPSKTANSVNLTWTASTDNVGVTGYEVFVNGSTTAATTSTSTSASVPGLAAGTAYSFQVKARDAAGNRSAASGALSVTTNAASGIVPPPVNAKWDYQIGGSYAPASGVTVVSRDRLDPIAPGLYNVCYVNVMQTQPDGSTPNASLVGTAAWWKANHDSLLLKNGSQYVEDAGWPGELLFDVRTAAKRTSIAAIVNGWIDGCDAAGFDAIEPDNIDAQGRSQGLMTHAQIREYVKLLVQHAHSVGLAIGQKNSTTDDNDAPLWETDGPTFVNGTEGFDFAVAEECNEFTECGTFNSMYPGRVLVVEYTTANYNTGCSAWGATLGVIQRNVDVRPNTASGYVYKAC